MKIVKEYGSVSPLTPLNDGNVTVSSLEAGSIRAVLTRPVLIAIQNYGCLTLLDTLHMAILTIFLPIPIAAGGLNLPPLTVGLIFGMLGLVDGLIQLVLFPPVLKIFGPKRIMTATMISFWVIFACFPWMHEIAKAHPAEPGTLDSRVWVVMGFVVVVSGMTDMGYSALIFPFIHLLGIHLHISYGWLTISSAHRP